MAKSWYIYTGIGDPTLSSNYVRTTVKHNALCGNQISLIYAEGENFRPDDPLSENIQLYIKNALATGTLQPERPLDSKKYVYLRYQET